MELPVLLRVLATLALVEAEMIQFPAISPSISNLSLVRDTIASYPIFERQVYIFVPDSARNASKTAAMVVDFHALDSKPLEEAYLTQYTELSKTEGFVVVMPPGGAGGLGGVGYSWNAAACCPSANRKNVDDIGFARALPKAAAELLRSEYGVEVDMRRVYASGMSNGGFMTNRVACQASDVYAAFAPVAGLYAPGPGTNPLWPSTSYECAPGRPVPILHNHGTSDPLVPMGGSEQQGFPTVADYVAGWHGRNGLLDEPDATTYAHGDVTCTSRGAGRRNFTICLAQSAS